MIRLTPMWPQKMLSAGGWALGSVLIVLAATSAITSMTLADIFTWVSRYFGLGFTSIFAALLLLGLYALRKLHQAQQMAYWFEVGQQAANGISTLALTFTLLGISLGIGSLSGQALRPDTVQQIIGDLTAQFSMAFMTTVIGLPAAAALRAGLSIMHVKQTTQTSHVYGHLQAPVTSVINEE